MTDQGKLIDAVRQGSATAVRALLEQGADPNAKVEGTTALHEAVKSGNRELVTLLLDPAYDTDINLKDLLGNTPLHDAVCHNQSGCIVPLLAAGADSALRNSFGQSAAQLAVQRGNTEAIGIFEKAGLSNWAAPSPKGSPMARKA
eukprot:comp97677_c0_seq1/m.48674 comp97677_c0_seq1/g.48674  ORF comp97677_c0_seq1/g.48674 comp97677_c0_seq1/m.48674 type:complete len:145 (-) comp97677_c0_seq1:172-606(-)